MTRIFGNRKQTTVELLSEAADHIIEAHVMVSKLNDERLLSLVEECLMLVGRRLAEAMKTDGCLPQ